jgi:hypothetical protein
LDKILSSRGFVENDRLSNSPLHCGAEAEGTAAERTHQPLMAGGEEVSGP